MTVKVLDLRFLGIPGAIAAFLIETSEGPLLVETGPHSTLAHLTEGLRAQGYELADVAHVFLTHIHLDHAGSAWALARAGAKIYLHPFGVRHLADPSRLLNSARKIYKDDMERLWGQIMPIPESQLVAVSDGEVLRVGDVSLRAWHTPGHAVHHIAWQAGELLFAGDVGGVKIGTNPVVPPCPPPDINVEDWINSANCIRELPVDTLYLTHFGICRDKHRHLEALTDRLKDWAEWMRPYAEKDEDATALVPKFQAYVADQLRSEGVSAENLKKYEAANPSWMSVWGLMRYWKKKFSAKKG